MSPLTDLLTAARAAADTPAAADAATAATARQSELAKPPGSLGALEALGIRLAAIAGECPPPVPGRPALLVAAGDHGVHAQGVTAWPQAITTAMVSAVAGGVAAASVIAEVVGAEVTVLDVGVAADGPAPAGVRRDRAVAAGTKDLLIGPAMTVEEVTAGILAGAAAARAALDGGADLLVLGDLGIANTTASACLVAALTGTGATEVTGAGAANPPEVVARKQEVIAGALQRHEHDRATAPADGDVAEGLRVLASLGGAEHAALVGVVLAAAGARVPVLLDGVISGAAALAAVALEPSVAEVLVAGHRSAEPAATIALASLGLDPLVDLGLRLGEGTGALLAVPLVQSAAATLGRMARIADLEV